jgi:hypothetical protein
MTNMGHLMPQKLGRKINYDGIFRRQDSSSIMVNANISIFSNDGHKSFAFNGMDI